MVNWGATGSKDVFLFELNELFVDASAASRWRRHRERCACAEDDDVVDPSRSELIREAIVGPKP